MKGITKSKSFRIARMLILAYLGVCLLMFSIQRIMLFPATRELNRDPSTFDWEYEDVMLNVGGGETSHAWYVPLEGARGVVLFSHGNAGNIADRLESMGLLRKMGLSVLAYDYGGYGRSSGSPSETRCCNDIRAAWSFLINEKNFSPEEIVLFGRSLGGAVTCDLAREVKPAATVLESTFLSVEDMAMQMFPFQYLPVRWLVRDPFMNKEKIAEIKSPLLMVHSPDDTVVPYSHGKKLFELAREPKTFLEIHGDHNIGFVESEPIYRKGWEDFLGTVLPK